MLTPVLGCRCYLFWQHLFWLLALLASLTVLENANICLVLLVLACLAVLKNANTCFGLSVLSVLATPVLVVGATGESDSVGKC